MQANRNVIGLIKFDGIELRLVRMILTCYFYRIFTTLPQTGERMYLSDVRPNQPSKDDTFYKDYSHLSHKPAELDVTHLLPPWSLRLHAFPPKAGFSRPNTFPASIFRNERSSYPFLIGQNEGRVRIDLIGAPMDHQPLASEVVSIVDSKKNDFVRLKAECIVSYITNWVNGGRLRRALVWVFIIMLTGSQNSLLIIKRDPKALRCVVNPDYRTPPCLLRVRCEEGLFAFRGVRIQIPSPPKNQQAQASTCSYACM